MDIYTKTNGLCVKEKTMNKKVVFILVVLLAVAMLFTACGENYDYKVTDYVDYSDEEVVGNGGMAVRQGDYLYFVNGVSDYTTDNTFKNVVKGAIMRYDVKSDGSLDMDSLTTVVPKKVFSSYVGAGIYVYGEWIYYVTPANVVDRDGNALTEYVEFMRTKTDGSGTEVILRVKGNTVEYAFSENALVYCLNGVLYSAKLQKNTTPVVITDEATGYAFSKANDYNPDATSKNADSYVYYTKASETTTDTNNELWVASFDFAESGYNEKVIEKFSYMTEAEKTAYEDLTDTTDTYNDKMFTISIVSYADGKLYYTKSIADGTTKTTVGTYSYDMSAYLNMAEPKFNKNNEVKYSDTAYTSIYETGTSDEMLVGDGSKIHLLKNVDSVWKYDRVCFTSNVTIIDVFGGYMYYYTSSSNDVYKFNLDGTETAIKLTSATPDKSYLVAEIMEGKLFYVHPDYKYVYVTDLNDGEDEMLGKYNDADQATIDELEGDEE